jgi:hypothetical protein
VSGPHLTRVRDWLREKNIDVVGGIATVPGNDFGVRQEGPLAWFNWQNPKTRRDLEKVIRETAGIFEQLIVDDFLCTGDASDESKAAKGDRPWPQYRRALITDVARSVLVAPAKEVNPSITMIVKFPQWYDRFHLFGYDTETLPRIFDRVWVGTETRGRTTRRFGFVQPYEAFVNYRWLADIAQQKIGGAWFDHGDCREHDFIDQAYMSVLAGARELVLFNLGDVVAGHPDHPKLVAQFHQLADLAAALRLHPVRGIASYKPPNSDPAGDMYLMDFLGMLGIPVAPVHQFPEKATVIFLPAPAAADPNLMKHVRRARRQGAHVILTTSLLATSPQGDQLARWAGLSPPVRSQPFTARLVPHGPTDPEHQASDAKVELESPLEIDPGRDGIVCTDGSREFAFLVAANEAAQGVWVLNTHTYSQADFDAVGEVLLSPRPLGLLDMAGPALETLRAAFRQPPDPVLQGPSCVTLHPLACPGGDAESYVLQNFNPTAVSVALNVARPGRQQHKFEDGFTGKHLTGGEAKAKDRTTIHLVLPPRDRVWVRPIPSRL